MVNFLMILMIFLIVIWAALVVIEDKLNYQAFLYEELIEIKEEEIKYQWEYIGKLQKQVNEIIVLYEKHKGE